MTILRNLRSHFGRSFGQTLQWMFQFVENQPAFLRPALYGAFFIWALILFRGGLIVLPIALPILFFSNRHLFWQLLLTFLVLAPAGGFAGGLLYGLISPIANRLGVVGTALKFTVAAWAYLVVLVFVIIPFVEPEKHRIVGDSGDWVFIGGFGLVLGIALTVGARRDAA